MSDRTERDAHWQDPGPPICVPATCPTGRAVFETREQLNEAWEGAIARFRRDKPEETG